MLSSIRRELRVHASINKAKQQASYFKTGPGEYGEGDVFLGLTVPTVRAIAKKHKDLPLDQIQRLASSKYHEERLCALVILNHQYLAAQDNTQRKMYFDFWLELLFEGYVNNWDLVDVSAPVLGEILSRHIGYNAAFIHGLARSSSLWERRAAIIITFPLIRLGKFGPTLAVAKDLLADKHDLIHKATGWMLREVGNRDKNVLDKFLENYSHEMPRTMLRYAIEKHSPKERAKFLAR